MQGTNQSANFWKFLSARIKIRQILVSFETTNRFSFKFCINLQSHETQLLCTFLAGLLYTFNKRSLSKYKFGEIKSLKFGNLMGYLRQNIIKFQLKKYIRIVSHKQSLKKKWLVVSNMIWGILLIFIQPFKSYKILLHCAIFVQSIWSLC